MSSKHVHSSLELSPEQRVIAALHALQAQASSLSVGGMGVGSRPALRNAHRDMAGLEAECKTVVAIASVLKKSVVELSEDDVLLALIGLGTVFEDIERASRAGVDRSLVARIEALLESEGVERQEDDCEELNLLEEARQVLKMQAIEVARLRQIRDLTEAENTRLLTEGGAQARFKTSVREAFLAYVNPSSEISGSEKALLRRLEVLLNG